MRDVTGLGFDENQIGRHDFIAKQLTSNVLANKHVLDIGCGFGWFCAHAKRQRAMSVTGIEPDHSNLSTARSDKRLSGVNLQVGSATDIGLPDDSFDVITAWEVLEHIPKGSEIEMFKEISRVLRVNGVAYLSTPNKDIRSILFDPAFYFGHRHYSQKQIQKYASFANLNVDQLIIKAGWGEIVWMLNIYFSKWILKRKPIFYSKNSRWVNRDWSKQNGFATLYVKLVHA